MDWQELAALTIVVLTAATFLWSRFRRRRFSFERHTGCGCSAGHSASGQSITFHARKGERPQVLVKMK